MVDTSSLGGKLGGRIAGLVAQSTVVTKQALAPHTVSVAMQFQDQFFRLVGAEIRNTIGEPLGRIADSPNAPKWVKDTFGFLARGHGQWQGFLAQSVGGQALGTGLGPLLTNELAPVIGEIIKKTPNGLIDIATSAALVARHIMTDSYGRDTVARQGLDARDFELLVDGNRHDADPGSLMEAYRRGNISEPRFIAGMRDAGVRDDAIPIIVGLVNSPLSPADAADMVQRGIIDDKTGAAIASQSGVNLEDWRRLVTAAGQAPATQDLLFLYRRGKIDKARLEHGIRQGNTRNEWIDAIEALGQVPMSTADAIAAAVQNHLSIAQAKAIAIQNGLEPDHFQPLLETAGSPLSMTDMLDLWNRGLVGQSDVEQALREGHLKNSYIPWVLQLRRYVLPPDTIRLMYEHGVLTKERALRGLLDRGLNAEDAAAYLQFAVAGKMAASKDLTESTIRTLYAEQGISHDVAKQRLIDLGYDDAEAEQILSISDLQKNLTMLNSAVSRIHARFVAHRIDETGAVTAMDALHVPPDQRDAYVDTWRVERDLNVPTLTVAQMASAAKKGIIDWSDMYTRLTNLGYDDTDASIIILIYGGQPPTGA